MVLPSSSTSFQSFRPPTSPSGEAGRRYGNYELVERIGAGGMAEVFRARYVGLAGFQRQVVVKRILPEFARREDFALMFIDEAKIAALARHPNVVQMLDLGRTQEGELYMAMELIEGADLRTLSGAAARSGFQLPPWFGVRLGIEVASGLSHIHTLHDEQGRPCEIVHRDVTPSNIFISRVGEVKLGDFGIARAAGRSHVTQQNVIKGCLPYIGPEVLVGGAYDARADVFALGVVIYQAITGRSPFPGREFMDIAMQMVNAERLPPSFFAMDIPPALDHVILDTLEVEPDRRIQTAEELRMRLAEVLSEMPVPKQAGIVDVYRAAIEGGSRAGLGLVAATVDIPRPEEARRTGSIHTIDLTPAVLPSVLIDERPVPTPHVRAMPPAPPPPSTPPPAPGRLTKQYRTPLDPADIRAQHAPTTAKVLKTTTEVPRDALTTLLQRVEHEAESPEPETCSEMDELEQILESEADSAPAIAPLPAMAVKILDGLVKAESSVNAIFQLVSKDPAISAGIFRAGTSLMFRRGSEPTDLRSAIVRIGIREASQIAAALAAESIFSGGTKTLFAEERAQVYVASMTVAFAASELALDCRAKSDTAFIGGMFVDIGRAVLLERLSDLAHRNRLPDHLLTPDVLNPVIDLLHVEAGLTALKAWKMPPPLPEICLHHHDAQILDGPDTPREVHVIRAAAALYDLHLDPERASVLALRDAAQVLGLDKHRLRTLHASMLKHEEKARLLIRQKK